MQPYVERPFSMGYSSAEPVTVHPRVRDAEFFTAKIEHFLNLSGLNFENAGGLVSF